MVRMSQRKDKESGINRQIPKRLCGRTQRRKGGGEGKEIRGNLCPTFIVNLPINTFLKHFFVK